MRTVGIAYRRHHLLCLRGPLPFVHIFGSVAGVQTHMSMLKRYRFRVVACYPFQGLAGHRCIVLEIFLDATAGTLCRGESALH